MDTYYALEKKILSTPHFIIPTPTITLPRVLIIAIIFSGKMHIVKLLKKNEEVKHMARLFGGIGCFQDDIGRMGSNLAVIRLVYSISKFNFCKQTFTNLIVNYFTK